MERIAAIGEPAPRDDGTARGDWYETPHSGGGLQRQDGARRRSAGRGAPAQLPSHAGGSGPASRHLIFFNNGMKLAVAGSPVLVDLGSLEARGESPAARNLPRPFRTQGQGGRRRDLQHARDHGGHAGGGERGQSVGVRERSFRTPCTSSHGLGNVVSTLVSLPELSCRRNPCKSALRPRSSEDRAQVSQMGREGVRTGAFRGQIGAFWRVQRVR